ncbi:IPT domain,Immunoglobulin E-set,Immunoglobulin-like fold [Cinara cedri]|uniref:IPT domain,Immunoglobulin E-set,Immunoglobulin-like fold n=1 Tax=Cinara cedri TaxID=506608 RepID=A0A5E4MTK0_9HEMI|nr:IPT domain,Immunoglobulin E-set,Immunoglobulin-like fold [Cinara cedri]
MTPKCSSRSSITPSSVLHHHSSVSPMANIGPDHGITIEVFVDRRPKFQYHYNHSFLNRCSLATIMVTLLFNFNSNGMDCKNNWNCMSCTNSSVYKCSWSIEKQKCYSNFTIPSDLKESRMVANRSSCPNFKILTKKKHGDNFSAMVTISNDQNDLIGLLKEKKLMCQIDEDYFNASVSNDSVVCSDQRLYTNESLVQKITDGETIYYSYISVVFDDNRLVFNKFEEHYIKKSNASLCSHVICKSCAWNDDQYMVYCVKYPRNINNTCTCSNENQFCDIRKLSNLDTDHIALDTNKCNTAIKSFKPLCGPWTDVTNLQVELNNHTMLFINDKSPNITVTIAGRNCTPITFLGNNTIYCPLLPEVKKIPLKKGPVLVSVQPAKFKHLTLQFQSETHFNFIEPKIIKFWPTYGPTTGGTKLTINGEMFGSSSPLKLLVANKNCKIIDRHENQLICETNSNQQINKSGCLVQQSLSRGPLKLIYVGHGIVEYNETLFEYVVYPTVAADQEFSGIMSGNTRLMVRGQHFACLNHTKICVGNRDNCTCHYGKCQVLNDTCMVCETPKFEVYSKKVIPMSFYANITTKSVIFNPPNSALYHLYPDPTFSDFVLDGCCNVTINSMHLIRGYHVEDLSIRSIGNSTECLNISMTTNQIYCQLPPLNPLPNVISVTIGFGLTINVPMTKSGETSGLLALMVLPNIFTIAYIMFTFITLLCVTFFGLKSSIKYDLLSLRHNKPLFEMKQLNRRQSNSTDDKDESGNSA